MFAVSLLVGGASLILAASMSTLALASLFVAVLGVCAGCVYVLGFTLLHESVDDDLRGRIFSALYTLVRFCVLIAFAVGPFLSDLLDKLSHRVVDREISTVGAVHIAVPGVRLTLWLAGLIIIGAGVLAVRSDAPGGAWLASLHAPGARSSCRASPLPITEVKQSHEHPSELAPTRAGRGASTVTGRFIAFEGGEGSGKSTQAARLADRIGARQHLRAGRHAPRRVDPRDPARTRARSTSRRGPRRS